MKKPRATGRIYLNENVYDAALKRIRWLFSEFENVMVDISGGKDSDAALRLTLMVAEELGRLPLKVRFIDQEAEWESTITHVRNIFNDPRIEPLWLQVPLKMTNATSETASWLYIWDDENPDDWIRPKEPNSIKENNFGAERFAAAFPAHAKHMFGDAPLATITGVRADENLARGVGLTTHATYKGETWGRVDDRTRGHYTFAPLYDWTFQDIWKAIHDHKWPYNSLYDLQYQHGVPLQSMRVSNLYHETAVSSLAYVQDAEPDTWNKIVKRITGVQTTKHVMDAYRAPKELPPMFTSWQEYRDHLLENLITDETNRNRMRRMFERYEKDYSGRVLERLYLAQISTILVNDYEGTKLKDFGSNSFVIANRTRNRELRKAQNESQETD